MQKGKGFFRLVVVISIFVYITAFLWIFFTIIDLPLEEYTQRTPIVERKKESVHEKYGIKLPEPVKIVKTLPLIEVVFNSMVGGIASIIPIWIIYGLTIYVVKGFMGKEKRGENE